MCDHCTFSTTVLYLLFRFHFHLVFTFFCCTVKWNRLNWELWETHKWTQMDLSLLFCFIYLFIFFNYSFFKEKFALHMRTWWYRMSSTQMAQSSLMEPYQAHPGVRPLFKKQEDHDAPQIGYLIRADSYQECCHYQG